MAKNVCAGKYGLSGEDDMACVELTDANFQEEVLKSKQPALVVFLAKWSGSCHIIAPALREMDEKYKSRVKFCKLDVDSHAETTTQYGIQRVPTILLFRDGRLVDHIIGITSKTSMAQKLNALLGCGEGCELHNLSCRSVQSTFGEILNSDRTSFTYGRSKSVWQRNEEKYNVRESAC